MNTNMSSQNPTENTTTLLTETLPEGEKSKELREEPPAKPATVEDLKAKFNRRS